MPQTNKTCSKCGVLLPHTDLSLCNDCSQAKSVMIYYYLVGTRLKGYLCRVSNNANL